MAVPFKSTVFTGGSFSASGSNGHGSAGLLIYSASRAESGLMPAADLLSIGKDVFVYVSGVAGSRGTSKPGAVVLGGDLIISGTAYYSDGTVLGSGGGSSSPVYLASTTAGSVYSTGSFAFVGNEAGVDAPSDKGSDVNFYVKGTAGSRGTGTAGTALFSGDLYVSGTVYSNEFKSTIISSSIIYSSGSTRFGDSADDTHTFTGGITGSDLRLSGDLAVNGGDITSTALSPTLFNTSNNNDVEIGRHLTSLSIADQSTGTGFTMNVGQNRSGNFTLNMGNAVATGATKTVNIATNAGVGSLTNITLGSDTAGTAGTTFLKTPKVEISGRAQVTGSLVAPFITGSLTQLVNGTSYLAAGSNVTITTGSSGQVTISSTGGAASVPSYFSSTTNTAIFTTGSAAFVGTGNEAPGSATAVDAPTDKGSDVYFYVSGSTAGKGTSNGKVALYGGHLVVSGSQYVSGSVFVGQAGSVINYVGSSMGISSAGDLTVSSTNLILQDAGGNALLQGSGDLTLAFGASTNTFLLSNALDTDQTKFLVKATAPVSAYVPVVEIGNEADGGASLIVRGDFFSTGFVTASLGLSGSLTRLYDGRSYLAAGSNVTITSESNGQVTISSTGGSGSPAGSNTYVQFNDSGSFGASSLFSFEKATNTLSIQNITLGSNIDSQAADSRWYLKNNSADALSFWDGTSGSRRFQINMGDSQERFIAYDGSGFAAGTDKDLEIVHDGTDSYIKNATGKLYLSGSTSGVFVTGSTGLIIADGVQPSLAVRASSDATNQGVFYQEIGGDTYISNQKNSGKFFSSVKTSAGVAVRYLRAIPNAVNYNTIVSFVQGLHDFFDPQANTTDVNFYVGGKPGSKDTSGQRGTALFAGDMVISGSTHMQSGGSITGSFSIQGSIIPSADSTYTLGTDTQRWGHVYTGDLHLRNERGDWTILEEPDYLCVINNKTGKKYKMMLQPID